MKKSVRKTAGPTGPTVEGLFRRVERNPDLPKRTALKFLELLAERDGLKPGKWLERSQRFFTEHASIRAEQERWEKEMEPYDPIDGFYSTCGCAPSVEVVALAKDDSLVHYNGESVEPVTLAEALELLAEMNIAARMFAIEPWNNGTSYTAQIRWHRLLASALQKGGAR